MYNFIALIVGLLFGVGLLLSGMTNPEKVIGFLDFSGLWDPSLAFVMAGAIGIGLIGFTIAKKKLVSYLKIPILLPATTTIDLKLVTGSAIFGIGWGLAGICPGPALVALGAGISKALLFVISMLAGMGVYQLVTVLRK
ncbi:MAG: hypothetical protein LBP90_02870 [Burkholderiales bacterium]|jgi:uncharacterized membrane protein YedE/YeeE|nr:hypothetical protein [Burkholderiales bacterium]